MLFETNRWLKVAGLGGIAGLIAVHVLIPNLDSEGTKDWLRVLKVVLYGFVGCCLVAMRLRRQRQHPWDRDPPERAKF